jgi:hypothetical protein
MQNSTLTFVIYYTPVVCTAILIADCCLSSNVVSKNREKRNKEAVDEFFLNSSLSDESIAWIRQDRHALQLLIDTCKKKNIRLEKALNMQDEKGNRCFLTHRSSDDVLKLLIEPLKEKTDFTIADFSPLSFFEELVNNDKKDLIESIIKNKWVTPKYIADVVTPKINDKTLKIGVSVRISLAAYIGISETHSEQDLINNVKNMSIMMGHTRKNYTF